MAEAKGAAEVSGVSEVVLSKDAHDRLRRRDLPRALG